jgi:hypothetical protein
VLLCLGICGCSPRLRLLRCRTGRSIHSPLKKAAWVERHLATAITACGATADVEYRVIPLLVTAHIEPAAYGTTPRIPFTTEADLEPVLTSPTDPTPGPNP